MSTKSLSKTLVKAAKKLAKSGQPVFPCKPTGPDAKRPYTKNGFNSASLDKEQIKRWWSAHPDAAIGIPTGIVYDVLDVDTKSGADGRVHLPMLNRLGLLDGCKRVVRTPSGGWHLYFSPSPLLGNRSRRDLGLDVRAKGGYVLAPPSRVSVEALDEDDSYSGSYVDFGETVGSTDEPIRWDLIINCIQPLNNKTNKAVDLPEHGGHQSLAGIRHWLSKRQPGERNNSLHWAAYRCVDNGIDPHELLDVATVGLGLAEEEVLKTIGSVLRSAGKSASDLMTEAESLFGR